ncbi:exported hypothetical protein [Agrobacterium genomosp. 2 str. CFBP 5494]|uniref:Uncharacterized protein n=1 Tax=Agrobacterium genomosp. 2 str. CFBP 5494 TaxID=1183436 RepID=A0A9W5F5L1_9HYPH|nr:exported hypothetical protein [Agrobacterium genomosp. 2 str. CFBP 5494]
MTAVARVLGAALGIVVAGHAHKEVGTIPSLSHERRDALP